MWYPNNSIAIYKKSGGKVRIKEINVLSVEQFIKFHREYDHIINFKNLLLRVKSMMKKYSNQIENLDDIMSFFQEQELLEDYWKEITAGGVDKIKNSSLEHNNVKLAKTSEIEK